MCGILFYYKYYYNIPLHMNNLVSLFTHNIILLVL